MLKSLNIPLVMSYFAMYPVIALFLSLTAFHLESRPRSIIGRSVSMCLFSSRLAQLLFFVLHIPINMISNLRQPAVIKEKTNSMD